MSKIDSTFAILDVKKGRHDLAKRLGPINNKPGSVRIPVVIHGSIIYQSGNDDGVSIEFAVEVEKVEEVQP